MSVNASGQDPFDVEAVASNYSSHAKVDHLLYIAKASKDKDLRAEALRQALEEAKQAGNLAHVRAIASAGYGEPDAEWETAAEAQAQQHQQKLEADLATSKSNMVKESVRMAHRDLGDFFYKIGDLQNAFKSYVRMRDYCSTPEQIIAMCLAVIKVGFEINNLVHVSNYVQKAEQVPDVAEDAVVTSKLRSAAGLSMLKTKKYKAAAQKFTEVFEEMGISYNDVVAPQDVATMGALCSLATLTRPEMRERLMENIHFREYLESAPQVREIVHAFYSSRYTACLEGLEALRPALTLDMHLAPHVESLYSAIRSRALIQYTTPFRTVHLPTMAAAFGTTVGELQRELAGLIVSNQIAARIDSDAGALYSHHTDQRAATYHFALKAGDDYLRNTKALLLRANLQKHNFMQTAGPQPRSGGGATVAGGAGGNRFAPMLEDR